MSIDIADIDVGENIGARLQAAARRKRHTARCACSSQSRRAAAVAAEQEMAANIPESRAKLVEAEADVPRAIAEAFGNGSLNIMDYYRLKNVDADTRNAHAALPMLVVGINLLSTKLVN